MKKFHAIVSGRVQGVWFRQSTLERAKSLGVRGWARNLPTGEVEVVAEGEDEAVEALAGWLHHGPSAARVDGVARTELAPDPANPEPAFAVRRS